MLARGRRKQESTIAQRRWLGVAFVLVLASLATAPGAGAATFCVKAPSCHGTSEPDLPVAVAQSAIVKPPAGAANKIVLGAGTFGWPSEGTAEVKAGDPPVQIQGAGASTILDGDPGGSVLRPVLELENSSTVAGLTVKLASGERLGIELSATSSGTGITVDGSQASPGSVGVDVEGGGSLRASTVTMSRSDDQTFTFIGPSAVAVELSKDGSVPAPSGATTGTATVAGDTLTGAIGLDVRGGSARGQQLRVTGTDDGALVTDGSLTLDDSLLQVAQPRLTSSAIGVATTQPFGQVSSPHATIRQSTISADDGQFSAGVFGGPKANVSVDSVVITHVANAIRASDGGNVAIGYSDFDPTTIMQTGGTVSKLAGNINAAPGFAGGGNFALTGGSKLVDAGNPAEPVAGAPSVDLIGDSRVFGRHADIGACEYVGSHTPRCPGGKPISHGKRPAPRLSISGGTITLSRRGTVVLSVSCPANASDICAGTITLRTVERLGRKGHKRVAITAGSTRYRVGRGRSQTVSIHVSRGFVTLLRRYGSLNLAASAKPSKRRERKDATSVTFLLVYKK